MAAKRTNFAQLCLAVFPIFFVADLSHAKKDKKPLSKSGSILKCPGRDYTPPPAQMLIT